MATVENIKTLNIVAGADLSAAQYLFVKAGATANSAIVSGNGENAIGVLLDTPLLGQAGVIAISGKTKAIAGETIAVGALVSSDAAGKAVVPAAGEFILGTALTAGAANTVIEVLFDKNGKA